MSTNSALVERKERIMAFAPQVKVLLPETLKVQAERICRMASLAIANSAQLQQCDSNSLVRGCAQAASLGLDVGGVNGHAYLIARRVKGKYSAQLQIGYRGMVELGARGGFAIKAAPILVGDEFEYWEDEKGPHFRYKRKNSEAPSGENINGAWCRITGNGLVLVNHLTLEDIVKRRNVSSGWQAFKDGKIKSTPWDEWPGPMAAKSAVHDGSRFLPKVPELIASSLLDLRAETGEPGGYNELIDDIPDMRLDGDVIDAPAEVVEDGDPRTNSDKQAEFLQMVNTGLEDAKDARRVNSIVKEAKGMPFADDEFLAEVNKRCETRKAEIKEEGKQGELL